LGKKIGEERMYRVFSQQQVFVICILNVICLLNLKIKY